ncbi:MAG: aminoacyl--tRNA ligase-related protein [Patescibacteria group bacterium]|nr:aminoacyl--tRNA ligase-related protein [Patescibacteria group bacterium]
MRVSLLFSKTKKEIPSDNDSRNAELLIKAGYVNKLQAGVYSYLHLGNRVTQNISNIVREEMDAIGGSEISLPALQPKSLWDTTGRYDTVDVNFTTEGAGNMLHVLGSTHEEVITPLAKECVQSYKDLPVYPYQIQTKFRNESRAKSGIMRGREFLMKDLYSFHTDEEDLNTFYEKAIVAYNRVFDRLGISAQTYRTTALGGAFTKNYSDEFQTITPAGEDTTAFCPACRWAENVEVNESWKTGDSCPRCAQDITVAVSAEVGNIFKLGTKFSESFDLHYTTVEGKKELVQMGCYGIGISRVMGTIVEVLNDEKGIVWPESIAPYKYYLVSIGSDEEGEKLYDELKSRGVSVLYDDRRKVSPGQKFGDADLLGIPHRIVLSGKTLSV